MKNILLIIGLLIGLVSLGQPGYQKYPTRAEFISTLSDSSIHIPKGCGKPLPYTSVNTKNWKYGFALYGDTCNKHMYFYTDSTWFLLADSIWSDIRYLANTIQCGLTCSACGIVTYTGTGMHYYVSPAYYNIDFVPYFFAGDSVILADGDATFDRFDAIVLTATGVDTIMGIPTSDPQLPQFDPCANILLTYVLVTAGTTTPAQISDEVIYDENVETWTHTTGGTISANFAGTAQVFHGTKSITISSWSNNSYINFLGPSSYINSNYSTLSFWVRLTAIMVNNQNVSVQFFNNTTAVSNQVVGQITKGNITTFQSVAFNMSQFTFTSPVFNTVRIQFSGSQSNTFYLDWIRLQAGIVQPPAPTGLNNAYTRVTDGTTTATAIGGDIIKLRANAPLHTTVTNNDATHGDNALFTVDTLRSIANSLATNGIVKKQIDSLSFSDKGFFSPNQTSSGTTTHDANYNNFLLNNINVSENTAGVSGNYTTLHQDSTLISLYALHNTGAVSSDLWVKPDSIRLLPFQGKLNIDSIQQGFSTDSVMVWNKVTGRVGYINSSSVGGSVNIYNSDGTLNNWRILTGGDKSLTMTFNSIDSSGLILSSTSTAAANNRQRLIDASLSGANSTGSQSTYGIYSANTHTGTSSTNYGIYGSASGGTTNYGVYGESSTTYGVFGFAPSTAALRTVGVYGQSDVNLGVAISGFMSTTNGIGVLGLTASSNSVPVKAISQTATANAVETAIHVTKNVLGQPLAGAGASIDFRHSAWTGSTTAEREANKIVSYWTDPSSTTYTSVMTMTGANNGGIDTLLKLGDRVTLTESTATLFAQTTIGTGKIAGGEINVTIEANDGTDFQARTLRFIWTAVNKAGTTTITIGTPEEVVASSSGATLTATITAVDGGSGLVQFKANAVSSLTQTTLRCSYQMSKNF